MNLGAFLGELEFQSRRSTWKPRHSVLYSFKKFLIWEDILLLTKCVWWVDFEQMHTFQNLINHRLWFSKNVVPPTVVFREDCKKWHTLRLRFPDSWSVKTKAQKIPQLRIFFWDCPSPSDFPWEDSNVEMQEERGAHSASSRFYWPTSTTWIGCRNEGNGMQLARHLTKN